TRDWSVCTTWLVLRRKYFLIDVYRARLEFPQLRRQVFALAQEYQPNRILVEHAGIGLQLIQDLHANPFQACRLRKVSNQKATSSCEWKRSAHASRAAKYACPAKRRGLLIFCTKFWPSPTAAMTINVIPPLNF